MLFEKYKKPLGLAGTIVSIIVVAFLYYITGVLGIFLGGKLSPGIVTAIWPPSGIALAAVLLLGYRVLPGIFIGSLVNNYLFLSKSTIHLTNALLVGLGTGVGASLQAAIGAYLIFRFAGGSEPFKNAKDSFKFLIFGLLSCIVNATIGTTVTYLNHYAELVNFLALWWTWWLGDSAGILIFTPLLLAWFQRPFFRMTVQQFFEGALIVIAGIVLEKFIFRVDTIFLYLLILIPIWAVFRLGIKGGTLIVLVVVAPSIWDTYRGMGPFQAGTMNDSLLRLQEFMGICAGITLVIAGVLSERAKARRLLEVSNVELENKVQERTQELVSHQNALERTLNQVREMQNQVLMHEKLASLGTLVGGVIYEINNPLNMINNFSSLSLQTIKFLKDELDSQKAQLQDYIFTKMMDRVQQLGVNMHKIQEQGKRADKIVQNILQHIKEKSFAQPTDINALLKEYVTLAYHSIRAVYPFFEVKIETSLDESIEPIEVVQNDIGRAFLNIANNSFYAAYQKKKRVGEKYRPILNLITVNAADSINIVIRDNGDGIPTEVLDQLFTPLRLAKPSGQGTGLGLSISYDIIVKEHKGSMKINSIPEEFTEIMITLPKST